MGTVQRLGEPSATFVPWGAGDETFRASMVEVLTEWDHDYLLAAYVEDEAAVDCPRLRHELAGQAHRALFHTRAVAAVADRLTE